MAKTYVLDTVDSTNAELARLLEAGPTADGTIVIARHQSAGRGRCGRTWLDEPGHALLFSTVFHCPTLTWLPLLAGLAITRIFPAASLKWPNDIIVAGGKAGGILTARVGEDRAIIGIGLNLGAVPAAIASAATHLPERDPLQLATEIVTQLRQLLSGSPKGWQQEYLQKMHGIGADATITGAKGQPERITISGIDATGALLSKQGERFTIGDVALLERQTLNA